MKFWGTGREQPMAKNTKIYCTKLLVYTLGMFGSTECRVKMSQNTDDSQQNYSVITTYNTLTAAQPMYNNVNWDTHKKFENKRKKSARFDKMVLNLQNLKTKKKKTRQVSYFPLIFPYFSHCDTFGCVLKVIFKKFTNACAEFMNFNQKRSEQQTESTEENYVNLMQRLF